MRERETAWGHGATWRTFQLVIAQRLAQEFER